MTNKEQFLTIIRKEFDTIDKKERKLFREFMGLNGIPNLSKRQLRFVEKTKDTFIKDDVLREKFYIFHFMSTLNSKWIRFDIKEVVTHFYKSSDKLNSAFMEAFGK